MYRINKVREIRRKKAEAIQAETEMSAAVASGAMAKPKVDVNEPRVSTSPFQAVRIMRAFDVFPDGEASVRFWTKLNVDLTRESVRGTCHLPHGLQTKVRVLAFCPDDEAAEMIAAGADFAGITEPVRRINQGWLGFDRCLASPAIMPQVLKIAKVLGPRKLMPNPKSGTVVPNVKQAIKEVKGGTLLEYRAEGEGELRATIADGGLSDAQTLDNMKFLVQTILRARPRTATGGTSASGSGPMKLPSLIPGGQKGQQKADASKDAYFLEASLQLLPAGPPIQVEPETMLPASTGYFR